MDKQLTMDEKCKVWAMYPGASYLTTRGLTDKLSRHSALAVLVDAGANLLLTTLSKITDEDIIIISEIQGDKMFRHRVNLKSLIAYQKERVEEKAEGKYTIYQYLLSKGYAMPIFFSVGHSLNGKNPIELGIAIEKP